MMELVGLTYRFKQYLEQDLDYGDDHHEVILTEEFRELLQTKIHKIE